MTLRHTLAPLPASIDSRQLEQARDTLVSCHTTLRAVLRSAKLDATRDFLDMLLMSIENEIDGIVQAADIIGDAE